jgi:hypothetical protein
MKLFIMLVIVTLSNMEGQAQRFNGGDLNECMIKALEYNNKQKESLSFCMLEKERDIIQEAPQPQRRPEGSRREQNPGAFQGKEKYAY